MGENCVDGAKLCTARFIFCFCMRTRRKCIPRRLSLSTSPRLSKLLFSLPFSRSREGSERRRLWTPFCVYSVVRSDVPNVRKALSQPETGNFCPKTKWKQISRHMAAAAWKSFSPQAIKFLKNRFQLPLRLLNVFIISTTAGKCFSFPVELQKKRNMFVCKINCELEPLRTANGLRLKRLSRFQSDIVIELHLKAS